MWIVAICVAVPVILFPAAFIWFINLSGLYTVVKGVLRKRQLAREK